jgi:hypothetical protein
MPKVRPSCLLCCCNVLSWHVNDIEAAWSSVRRGLLSDIGAWSVLAAPIQCCELTAPKINEVLLQAALPPDPCLHFRWIGSSDSSRGIPGVRDSTTPVNQCWGMEAENGSLRYANPAVRNGAQHKGTGGQTGPVNDNFFARFPHLRKEIQKRLGHASRTR